MNVEELPLRLSCQSSSVELELWCEMEHQWSSLTHGEQEHQYWTELKAFCPEPDFSKDTFVSSSWSV